MLSGDLNVKERGPKFARYFGPFQTDHLIGLHAATAPLGRGKYSGVT
jgi:hypothetical protein